MFFVLFYVLTNKILDSDIKKKQYYRDDSSFNELLRIH